MKALSIRQPWAWLIVAGYKDVENRSWPTKYRGRVLIQAGSRLADDYDDVIRLALRRRIHIPKDLPMMSIVGTVDLVDCVTESRSRWFSGPYGFVLTNPMQVIPIRYRGALGLFEATIDESQLIPVS